MAARSLGILAAGLMLVACGQSSSVASHSSPSPSSAATESPSSAPTLSPSTGASTSPSTAPTASPATRLVIQDYSKNQVRLARLDAVDVASVTGGFEGVAGGRAIVLNGQTLLAIAANGSVTTLGHLAGKPEDTGPGAVSVNPTLTQWIYTLVDFSTFISKIHLGSASGDRVIATVPPPADASFFQPFTWNDSGAYMVQQPTGLGGVGPFLEYRFPLATVDVGSGHVTVVSPQCIGEGVLDDGTLLCKTATGGLEVRPPNGAAHVVKVSTGTAGFNGVFTRLAVSADGQRFVAARNGNTNPNLVNYQMAVGGFTGSAAAAYGPADFVPDVWLSDGRVVADHQCWDATFNGGPCSQALDGTYLISADGKTRTLFFKLAGGAAVVAAL